MAFAKLFPKDAVHKMATSGDVGLADGLARARDSVSERLPNVISAEDEETTAMA